MATRPLNRARAAADPEAQLAQFIAKFDETDQALIRSVRRAMRKRLPTANELVWDNYNFFVIGYSPTEKPTDAPLTIAARAGGLGLCFVHGAKLSDPAGVLLGSGKQTRFVRLENARTLAQSQIEALISLALASAPTPMPKMGRGRLIIRSISAKQRPRRKTPRSA